MQKLAAGFLFLASAGLAFSSACTAGNNNTFTGGAGQGAAASSSSGKGGEGGGLITVDGGADSGPVDDDAGCVGVPFAGKQLPLDIFIMLDQSGSMDEQVAPNQTRWQAVTSALATFLQQPNLKDVSVGIQYFGLPFNGVDSSCNSADYAVADVEIAPLPGVAPKIITSMATHNPITQTPTRPALAGAIQHAKAWAAAHPDHVVVNVFATDGLPTECPPTDIPSIAAIAAAGVADAPKVLTFVIGVGDALQNLNTIAAAGGTGQAFLVSNANANQQFIDAMNKIRNTALGCQYEIPAPDAGMPDFTQVNVSYTPAGGDAELIPKVLVKGKCPADGDAWYYDNNAHPTLIVLCDSTCAKVSNAQQGSLINIVVGCKTIAK